MRHRAIAAFSVTASLLLAAARPRSRKANCRVPDNCRRPAAKAGRRSAAPPRRRNSNNNRSNNRPPRPSPTSRWRSARPRR